MKELIAAPLGTPVSAIGDGIVKKAQYSGGFGNLVIIKHSNGYESYYGHLSKYGKGVKKGARVKQGRVIAYVGSGSFYRSSFRFQNENARRFY